MSALLARLSIRRCTSSAGTPERQYRAFHVPTNADRYRALVMALAELAEHPVYNAHEWPAGRRVLGCNHAAD